MSRDEGKQFDPWSVVVIALTLVLFIAPRHWIYPRSTPRVRRLPGISKTDSDGAEEHRVRPGDGPTSSGHCNIAGRNQRPAAPGAALTDPWNTTEAVSLRLPSLQCVLPSPQFPFSSVPRAVFETGIGLLRVGRLRLTRVLAVLVCYTPRRNGYSYRSLLRD